MKQQSKRQAVNPYLPLYEYIPDGEPHVFGDRLLVRLTPGGEPVGAVDLLPSGTWTKFSGQLAIPDGDHTLCLCYEGKGRLDFLEFSLS